MKPRIAAPDLLRMRERSQKIVMLTAYDYPFARLLDDSEVDVILVGDSLGSVVQGAPTTLSVTLDEMVYHTRLVARAAVQALVIADMPFLTFQCGAKRAVRAAGRLVQEGGASAVKLEGGEKVTKIISRIVDAGIPVMAHIGLLPQQINNLGAYRVQGKDAAAVNKLIADALAVEKAGAFAVVVEAVPAEAAAEITAAVKIPTIGIGAGSGCSGQVLVLHDLLGLTPLAGSPPKFVKRYLDLQQDIRSAVKRFVDEVRAGKFPSDENSY